MNHIDVVRDVGTPVLFSELNSLREGNGPQSAPAMMPPVDGYPELSGWAGADEVHTAEVEALLVERSGRGDLHAMTNLYELHWGSGLAFAYTLTRDQADAEDITAHAFLKVISAVRSGKGPAGPFRPYLFRAIRSCVADHWRRRSYEYPVDCLPEQALEDPGFEHVDTTHDRELAAKAFSSLPLRWQQVIWQMDVIGLRPRQVAPVLDIEANAVSALLRRARRGLREAYLVEYIRSTSRDECHELLPLLARTVMDNASPRGTLTVERHARGCADCRQALRRLEDVHSTMRAAMVPFTLSTLMSAHLANCTETGCAAFHDFLQSPAITAMIGQVDATVKHKSPLIKAALSLAASITRFAATKLGLPS